MSWGTVESMLSLPILEDGHELDLRYEAVPGWRPDRLARNSATPCAASENHSG